MKSHFNSKAFAIVASVTSLLLSGCQTSTTYSKTQPTTNTPAGAKSAPVITPVRGDSEDQTQLEQGIKLLPIDEGKSDPSFQLFRTDLLAAIKRHDANFVLGALHPAIENGYDIEAGVDEFRKRWNPEDRESSVWDVLSSILIGGGSFTKRNPHREFCGPYVVSQWSNVVKQLPKGSDSLDYVAITGKDVSVRLEPKLTAPVVARLSYDVVRSFPTSQVLDRSTTEPLSWIKIKTPTGEEGYVPDSDVQGPMDYGACFRRSNGKWLITKLAARE